MENLNTNSNEKMATKSTFNIQQILYDPNVTFGVITSSEAYDEKVTKELSKNAFIQDRFFLVSGNNIMEKWLYAITNELSSPNTVWFFYVDKKFANWGNWDLYPTSKPLPYHAFLITDRELEDTPPQIRFLPTFRSDEQTFLFDQIDQVQRELKIMHTCQELKQENAELKKKIQSALKEISVKEAYWQERNKEAKMAFSLWGQKNKLLLFVTLSFFTLIAAISGIFMCL